MISVSRLLCDDIGPGDYLRYGKGESPGAMAAARPIVVWNCTRRCNLHCIHCYANAANQTFDGQMSTAEGKAFTAIPFYTLANRAKSAQEVWVQQRDLKLDDSWWAGRLYRTLEDVKPHPEAKKP